MVEIRENIREYGVEIIYLVKLVTENLLILTTPIITQFLPWNILFRIGKLSTTLVEENDEKNLAHEN